MVKVSPRQLLLGLLFKMRFSIDELPLDIDPEIFALLVERGVVAHFYRSGESSSYYRTQCNEPALVDALFELAKKTPLADMLTEEILASDKSLGVQFEQGLALQIPLHWGEVSLALQKLGARELQNYEIDEKVNIVFAPEGNKSLEHVALLTKHLHQTVNASATAPSGVFPPQTAGPDIIFPLKPRQGVDAQPALLCIQAKFWNVTDAKQKIFEKPAKQGLIDAMQTAHVGNLFRKEQLLHRVTSSPQATWSTTQMQIRQNSMARLICRSTAALVSCWCWHAQKKCDRMC
eukprot:TRINITY_DN310_c0_g1_i10.p1 TRINITY_DN310_c0_g1~~TRINITY_DN310_c0_g1_i10.p1  ORF type:complete len:290 (-),score=71.33 TRINITY_DN310_c0_g1_i10:74-943(-)